MTIRMTDVTRELMAAGLHGEQLLAAMGRLENLVSGEVAAIVAAHAPAAVPAPKPTVRVEDSGQRVINRLSVAEPGVDENGE